MKPIKYCPWIQELYNNQNISHANIYVFYRPRILNPGFYQKNLILKFIELRVEFLFEGRKREIG